MAIIVLHKPSEIRYVLVGTGYGAYHSTNSGFLGGDLFRNEQFGEMQLAALCDSSGCISWLPTEELQVLEVDGYRVDRLLSISPNKTGIKSWVLQMNPADT